MAENVGERSWNDASIRIALSASSYSKGLAWTSLAVGEDGAIIAFKARLDHVFHDWAEDCLLLREHVKDAIEFKLEVILLYLLVPQTVSRKVELDFTLFGWQRF